MEGKQKGCTFGKRGEYTFHQYETHKPSSNLEAEGIIWAFGSSLLQRLGDWQAHCSCIPLVHKVPFNVGATLRLAHKKCFCSSCYSNCPPTSLRPIRRPQNWKDIGHQWLSPQMSTPKSHFGRSTNVTSEDPHVSGWTNKPNPPSLHLIIGNLAWCALGAARNISKVYLSSWYYSKHKLPLKSDEILNNLFHKYKLNHAQIILINVSKCQS